MEDLWERIFGDSYATGEHCVVPGMDLSPGTTSTNMEYDSCVLPRIPTPPDTDTPMTESNPLATELSNLDPGFFRNLNLTDGPGSSSASPYYAPTPAPFASKRSSPMPSGGSSPLGSSSDGSKRPKLSRAAAMFQDVIYELREEGKRTNELIESICIGGNSVTSSLGPPLIPTPQPPSLVDIVPSIKDAYDVLYKMVEEDLIQRGSDEFYFAAVKILDETDRQGFMFLTSNSDRLAWIKYQMKKDK